VPPQPNHRERVLVAVSTELVPVVSTIDSHDAVDRRTAAVVVEHAGGECRDLFR